MFCTLSETIYSSFPSLGGQLNHNMGYIQRVVSVLVSGVCFTCAVVFILPYLMQVSFTNFEGHLGKNVLTKVISQNKNGNLDLQKEWNEHN